MEALIWPNGTSLPAGQILLNDHGETRLHEAAREASGTVMNVDQVTLGKTYTSVSLFLSIPNHLSMKHYAFFIDNLSI